MLLKLGKFGESRKIHTFVCHANVGSLTVVDFDMSLKSTWSEKCFVATFFRAGVGQFFVAMFAIPMACKSISFRKCFGTSLAGEGFRLLMQRNMSCQSLLCGERAETFLFRAGERALSWRSMTDRVSCEMIFSEKCFFATRIGTNIRAFTGVSAYMLGQVSDPCECLWAIRALVLSCGFRHGAGSGCGKVFMNCSCRQETLLQFVLRELRSNAIEEHANYREWRASGGGGVDPGNVDRRCVQRLRSP